MLRRKLGLAAIFMLSVQGWAADVLTGGGQSGVTQTPPADTQRDEAMAQTVTMKWEWPAGRTLTTKLMVRITRLEESRKGLFGLGDSPSFADYLPDARQLSAEIVMGSEALVGKTLQLRLPAAELGDLAVGDEAALGLLDDQRVCVCIAAVPSGDAAAKQAWLSQWGCSAEDAEL